MQQMSSNCMLQFLGAGSIIQHSCCSMYSPTDPTVLYTQLTLLAMLCALVATPQALIQIEVM